MDLKASKIELVRLILDSNDKALIEKMYNLFKSNSSEVEQPEFNKDQIEEIELGLKQLNEGQGISFKDYMKKIS
ncbi:MAG: hypothetical protein RI562_08010 [Salibacter sp.]|uniref:hypothetical protein n=1 Tax=Salibacter sp. TaxID=2010995 RepID=UPI002870A43F|nr:hypothetical protein [Salibacter sp.]MDR9398993.1 hypothetical protein [Salibacter sp.]